MMEEKKFNGTEIAKQIFSTIFQVKQRFGVNYIVLVLMGSNSQKIRQHNHQALTSFGTLKHYSFEQVKLWVKELIDRGYLSQTQDEYPVLGLLEKAYLVTKNLERVTLSEPDPVLVKNWSSLQKGESVAKTLSLFKEGKTVEQIAKERNLAPATIISHLAQAYGEGEDALNIDQFVPKEKQEVISQAFSKFGVDYLSPVKQNLDKTITWEDLKWVKAKLLRQQV